MKSADILLDFAPTDKWRDTVIEAVDIAEKVHSGQFRDEGTPYIEHPLEVARILISEFGILELEAVVLALLHDVPEKIGGKPDAEIIELLASKFGDYMRNDLDILVRKIGKTREARDSYYIGRIERASLRVKLVKLADRIHNVRSLLASPDIAKIQRYISETKENYVELAESISPKIGSKLNDGLTRADAKLICAQLE